jgi:hypothetical protein
MQEVQVQVLETQEVEEQALLVVTPQVQAEEMGEMEEHFL